MEKEINIFDTVTFKDGRFELEVSVSPSEETVWLTAEEMALLFEVQRSAVVKHSLNIIATGELDGSTCSVLEQVHLEGSRKVKRKVNYYNLDMIIAVGYRVNSRRGTLFRRWANSILKQYLLKGYSIDSTRVLVSQENYINLVNIVNRIDERQQKLITRVEKLEETDSKTGHKLFFQGQLYDAVSCIERIISKAEESLILIDGYVNRQTLDLLSKKQNLVEVIIITSESGSKITQMEFDSFNRQYGVLSIRYSKEFHDRFLILDRKELYHIGSSIKDAGKKTFGISKIDDVVYIETLLSRVS